MSEIWKTLYDAAKEKQNPRTLTPFVDAGGVSAAILTDKGNIYTGVCIDTCCSLGMCAERNAIAKPIATRYTHFCSSGCLPRKMKAS